MLRRTVSAVMCCTIAVLVGVWGMELLVIDSENRLADPEEEQLVGRSKRQTPQQIQPIEPPVELSPLPAAPVPLAMPDISFREIGAFVDQANAAVSERFDSIEPAIYNSGARQAPGTPAWFMAASSKTKVVAKNISRYALISEEATKYIVQRYRLSKDQVTYGLPTADVRGTSIGDTCPIKVDFPCQPRKYRAFNGYCNNVQNPRWGNANTRFLRFLSADYGDGVSVPRQAISGEFLPSAREVSLILHRENNQKHSHMTALAAMWGEFVYHDMVHIPQMAGYLGQRLKCCGIGFNQFHPECYPIRIPENDPFYARFNLRCQEYTRSGTAPRTGCTLGPREQINQVTSYLDASVVYGSSKEEAGELSDKRGRLKIQTGANGAQLLPEDDNTADCKIAAGRAKCFKAGDVRVNEHIGLTVLHTLWAREHNRLAEGLEIINPHWDSKQLFQEARRIVGAEIQHITYNEFLPLVLGEEIVEKYGLKLRQSGFFTGYSININAGIANSVGAASMRFLASVMPATIEYYNERGIKVSEKPIGQTFYNPLELRQGGVLDQIVRGFMKSKAEAEDEFIPAEMTNSLFQNENTGEGLDLASQIIQQGRDHGIGGYTRWRQFCGLRTVNDFSDLTDTMTPETIALLQRVYQSVHDIDLFTGGLGEISNRGALVGPTFGCLIGRQFHYLRRGDRYWYENDIPPNGFTKEQLHEIRKTTLARIICDNSDRMNDAQPNSMVDQDPFLNAPMACQNNALKGMDLRKWKTVSPNFIVPNAILEDSTLRAKRDLSAMRESEFNLFTTSTSADPKSPQGSQFGFSKPKRQAVHISNASFVLQFASARFVRQFIPNSNQRQDFLQLKDLEEGSNPPQDLQELIGVLPNVDVSDVVDIPRVFECDEQTLPCDHTSKFQTITGWCNNLQNPEFGKSMRAVARLLRPHYDDGLSRPRSRSVTGAPLPSPRVISVNIHNDVSAPHVRYTLMTMQYGQFLDHDLTSTPVNKGFGDHILDCRQCDSQQTVHPECLPIPIIQGDPFYPTVNVSSGRPLCLAFTRSMPGQLTLGYREQMNQVTAFVDASNVYGSDVCEARDLRAFQGGRLNITRNPVRGKDLLPQTTTNEECKAPSGVCFKAGDSRSSEQPGLAAVHTLFMREHNRIVDYLGQVNPHWNDEQLYLNGRRIVHGMMQHITYNEFLPRILGWNAINLYGLNLITDTYASGYDDSCNPTILNEFATAAFRFGHSLLKPILKRYDHNYQEKTPHLLLRDTFFNPDRIYEPNMIDEVVRGFSATSMENLDQFISEELTNHLFEDRNAPFSGLDLASLNIQRGRDHGLAPYNEYRALCNLTRARSWEDLSREISPPILERLRRTYADVNDVDLFSGGLSETPLHGGLVGPTFGCIIGIQFRNLRKCDRFWYENGNALTRFTEAQLQELRKVTLSRIACSNCETVDQVQRSMFDLPDPFLNPRVPCNSLPLIDLDLWRERVSCTVGQITIDVGQAQRISPCVMCTCTKEGPICRSLKIDNCFFLANSFTPEAILNDHVCKVQCAFAFRAFPEVAQRDSNQLGFS